jgi:class 3 adenylate cyclase
MHVFISETVAEHLEEENGLLVLHDDLHLKGIDETIRAFSFPLQHY